MAASYPSAVVGFPTHNSGDRIASADINNIQNEIVALETALLSSGLSHLIQPNGLRTATVTTLTIASGVVSATLLHHTVDTQGAASADDLDTINLGAVAEGIALGAGSLLLLTPADITHVVTVKHGTGNIKLIGSTDYAMSDAASALLLRYDGTNWLEIARSALATVTVTWATPTYASGDYTSDVGSWTVESGDVSSFRYAQIGKVMFISLRLSGTTVAGSPQTLKVKIPNSKVAASSAFTFARITNNGTTVAGYCAVSASGTTIGIGKIDDAAFTNETNLTGVSLEIFFETTT